jgi:putative nucleotidyltransferase with HDIG domain
VKQIIAFIINNFRQIITITLFIISGVIIILLFPWSGKFRYEYQKGKPWQHDEYIAPFDFPIYKYDQEITAERDSILKRFKPYFRYEQKIVEEQLEQFNISFDNQWNELIQVNQDITENRNLLQYDTIKKQQYLYYAEDLIKFVFEKGIVQNDEILSRVNNPDLTIVIIKDQFAEERDLSEIFTPKTAYEYVIEKVDAIADSIPDKVDRDFFRIMNINEFLIPNLIYDEETSSRARDEMIGQLSLTKGMIQTGERIISRGELVTEEKFRVLESLKREYEMNLGLSDRFNINTFGKILLAIISMVVLYLFLHNFRPAVLQSYSHTIFILLMVLLTATLSSFIIRYSVFSIYILPFAIVPIIIRTFFDSRLAMFVHLLTILIIGFWAPNGFEFVFLNIIAGIVAIFSLTNSYRRGILFQTAVIMVITYSLVYFAFSVIQEGKLANIDYKSFLWFGGNGLLVLTAYPLIFIFEKTFGFLSESTLFELADSNQPLLRQLAEKAPGTFQHSMQVANLAEEVIYKIGGNALLIRTGALYHDIGKMTDPLYFIENQSGDYNPHDDIEFDKSAEIIIGHVQKGVEIAKKHNLPQPIIDFIKTHHGTTIVQYFYRSFLKKHPGEEADLSHFTYPGPKPFSRETAVVMMADSVEASSRSLKVKDENSLKELVHYIIDEQIRLGQFDNANITFRDITEIKEILISKLINIYHVRIEYPKEE